MRVVWISFAILMGCQAIQASSDVVPIQEKATGQSLAGSILLNDSLYSNPASASFTSVYSVDATYYMPKSYAVSVLDTRTSGIGGGLGYFRRALPDVRNPLQGAKLALSGRAARNIGIGLAGKTLWGATDAPYNTKLTDFDAGLMANFNMMQLGLVARNILKGNRAIDENQEWSLGGSINYEQTLYLSVATVSDFRAIKPYQYGVGVEYVSPYYFALKAGYRIQPDNRLSYWSTGASFISPRFSLHYALEIPTQAGASPEHVFGTTIML